jgi:predicted NAD/FAD-dependent oxidoreductase
MVSLAEHLADGLAVQRGLRVEAIRRSEGRWFFHGGDGGSHGPFDAAVIAVPAPQAVPLLSEAPNLREWVREVSMAPCWAGMYVFAEPLDLDFDGAFLAGGALSWMARDSSKPGRPEEESWVLHADPGWTREHWDLGRDRVTALMMDEASKRFGPLPSAIFSRGHRWAFASTEGEGHGGPLYDHQIGIGVCGDWCRKGRVEGALLTGIEVAEGVLGEDWVTSYRSSNTEGKSEP